MDCGCAPFCGCDAAVSIPPRWVTPSLSMGGAQAAAVLRAERACHCSCTPLFQTLLQVMVAIKGNAAAHRPCLLHPDNYLLIQLLASSISGHRNKNMLKSVRLSRWSVWCHFHVGHRKLVFRQWFLRNGEGVRIKFYDFWLPWSSKKYVGLAGP